MNDSAVGTALAASGEAVFSTLENEKCATVMWQTLRPCANSCIGYSVPHGRRLSRKARQAFYLYRSLPVTARVAGVVESREWFLGAYRRNSARAKRR